jgi:glyoxylase-like metal-dependent hydrolase (beta-lactamase superfamily II)
VIEPTVQALTSALALDDWPGSAGALDLGGRVLTVLPTPGVSETALSVYDPYTDFLFTGTTVLPGRIVIRDFEAYDASIEKLRDFAAAHPVKWVMGGQIDMSATPGVDYRLRSNFRPNERALPLDPSMLGTVRDVVKLINGRERVEVLADLIVMNGVGRGHRPYGYPVYVPDPLLARRLR